MSRRPSEPIDTRLVSDLAERCETEPERLLNQPFLLGVLERLEFLPTESAPDMGLLRLDPAARVEILDGLHRHLLDTADEDGVVPIANLTLAFRDFYLDRLARGLTVEKPRARMARVAELSEAEIQDLILNMPFSMFAQHGFVDYGRDVSRVRFATALWFRLTTEDRDRLRETAVAAVERYYAASSAGAG